MEKLKNHKGHNSMLVLRPADAEETTVAWKLAMENMSTPTALIFSRQNITNLPAGNDYSQAAKGAYIVAGSDENPDVILVASGSEVATLVAGAELLRKDGVEPAHRICSVRGTVPQSGSGLSGERDSGKCKSIRSDRRPARYTGRLGRRPR